MTHDLFNQFKDFLISQIDYWLDFRFYVFTDDSMYFTLRYALTVLFICVIFSLFLSLLSVDGGKD